MSPTPPADSKGQVDHDPGLVERGPVETLAPSRTALVLVGASVILLGVLAGVGVLRTAPEQTLGTGETLVEQGPQTFTVGDAVIQADLHDQPWVVRERCPRWMQLNVLDDHATSVHLVWVDAVPQPATAGSVRLVEPPSDLAAWWRDQLHLRVEELTTSPMGGLPTSRVALHATPASRVEDGLTACGTLGGPAATGLRGPAAGWQQEVTLVDVDGTALLVIAAAWTGGDLERSRAVVDDLVATGEIRRLGTPTNAG